MIFPITEAKTLELFKPVEVIFDSVEEPEVVDELIEEEVDISTDIIENDFISVDNVRFEKDYTINELEMLAMITYAEAGNQCELGKRLVIDTVLNRVDHENYPDNITDVLQGQNAYAPIWGDTSGRYYVDDDIYQLVLEELESRTDDQVLFFRTEHFHDFGTPMFQVEDHFFSTY